MPLYHVTLTQGKAYSFEIEATSKTSLLNTLNMLSTAVVTNIKEVVYSKKHSINYVSTIFQPIGFYKQVNVFVLAKGQGKIFEFYFVKKTITKEKMFSILKKYAYVNGHKVDDLVSMTIKQ